MVVPHLRQRLRREIPDVVHLRLLRLLRLPRLLRPQLRGVRVVAHQRVRLPPLLDLLLPRRLLLDDLLHVLLRLLQLLLLLLLLLRHRLLRLELEVVPDVARPLLVRRDLHVVVVKCWEGEWWCGGGGQGCVVGGDTSERTCMSE